MIEDPTIITYHGVRKRAVPARHSAVFGKVIEKAFVPLVKLTDRASGVKCDISFGRNNGPSNVRLIRQYLRDFPSLKPLLLVIKCFLQQRMLNEVYSGGIGSYALLLLIVSHLQHYRWNFRHRISSNDPVGPNLGAALVDFFELYGTRFNYVNAGIGIKKNGCFYCKRRKYITDHRQPVLLSIEDPQDEKNEIAKNTFNLQSVCHPLATLLRFSPSVFLGKKGEGKNIPLFLSILVICSPADLQSVFFFCVPS